MMLRSTLPQNGEDLDLGKITKQNTDHNKEYSCEFDVVVVRKDISKSPSPTTKLQQKQKKRPDANETRKKANSHIPVLRQRSGKEVDKINLEKKVENPAEKRVRWDDVNLVQVSSPLIKHSPISAKEKRVIKSFSP
ncbi:15286_t:CDS:2 [Racocetra fulgida]|uniref:15286_t:CDS:1 n=1 Tax=Racocetra fulgida TaxID=60492 RepID=A0A9N9FER1_9GLOM|nr:15286_t:CDS:2 [Racocetra fulgida]